MLISEHFENQRKAFVALLNEKEAKGILIIQEFVERHVKGGLFLEGSGIEIFDYMNDNLGICFHHDGTGDCQQFFSIEYAFDEYTGESLDPVPTFSVYDLEDYSSKKYTTASEKYQEWWVNQYMAWALLCWQKASVSSKVPFAFFNDYYQNYYFDMLTMEHQENYKWSSTPLNIQLLPQELHFRISASKYHFLFLQKEDLILEIGFLIQPKFQFAYERQFSKGQWKIIQKINGDVGGRNDVRNIGGNLLRNALKEGFKIIELSKDIQPQNIADFILPSNLFGSKNHWGDKSNIEVKDFENQFNIQLPKDYHAFLRAYNGFHTHNYYGFGYSKYDSIRPIIFYGLTEKSDYDIVSQIEKMRFECLPDFIPIGEDLEKNQIWLGVSEGKKGQVIYKRFEAPQKKVITYEIDSSFQNFINEFYFDTDAGIEHIIAANDLESFKKYMGEQKNWDDGFNWNRTVIDLIIGSSEPRPLFLDFAFSEGIQINRIERYGHNLTPQIIKVFDKYKIAIPKICYSKRLQSILQSGQPFDDNEFDELTARCGNINLYHVYETLQKWIQHGDTPIRRSVIKKIKPYHKSMNSVERMDLIIDQKGIAFTPKKEHEKSFDLSSIQLPSDLTFPDGLINFLKKYQGDVPSLPFFEFIISAGNDHHFVELDYFLTLSEIENSFKKSFPILNKIGIEEHYLPIAITKSGGFVLINCQNGSKKFGEMSFLFNHIIRWDKNKNHQEYRFKKLKSNNLQDFLLSLLTEKYVFDEMSLQAKKGNIDYFKRRLGQGWNINTYTQTEQTCLHQAVRNNQHELAKFLLAHGANANLKVASPNWDSTLAIAMKYADEKMYHLIYDHSDLTFTSNFEELSTYLVKYYKKEYLK